MAVARRGVGRRAATTGLLVVLLGSLTLAHRHTASGDRQSP
jgi:hypothetical protein